MTENKIKEILQNGECLTLECKRAKVCAEMKNRKQKHSQEQNVF